MPTTIPLAPRSPRRTAARCAARLVATALLCAIACSESEPAAPGFAGSGRADAGLADAAATTDAAPCGVQAAALELSEGGRLVAPLQATPGAAVTVADGGKLTATVSPALELRISAPYGAVGEHAVTLNVACATRSASVPLAVTVRALSWRKLAAWTEGTDGPRAREYFALWVDALAPDTLYLFGGFTYYPKQFTPAADLWSFDLARETWQPVETVAAPTFPGGRVAPIPGTSDVLYFGGIDISQGVTPYLLRRFAAATRTWSDVPVDAPLPAGIYTGAFVHDAPRARYIAMGGTNHFTGPGNQVLAFHPGQAPSPGRWEVLTPAGAAPSGRTGFFYVHDAETQRLIVFSGDQQVDSWTPDAAEDTWALELAESPVRWVKLLGAQAAPVGRRNGAYALDPAGHRMFIYGGTRDGKTSSAGLFALDLERGKERWSEVPLPVLPEPRTSAGMVYDAARRRILLGFGNGTKVYADLWALSL